MLRGCAKVAEVVLKVVEVVVEVVPKVLLRGCAEGGGRCSEGCLGVVLKVLGGVEVWSSGDAL